MACRRFSALTLSVLCLSFGAIAQSALQPNLVSESAFRQALEGVIADYPTDGTHRYHWPKSGSWAGITRDLHYAGERVAKGDPQGRCYCCGLTFEVFVRAYEAHCAASEQPFVIPGLRDRDELNALRKGWFGADGNRRTLQNAVVQAGLGRAIEDFEAARRGDFVQLWRRSGSGHSVVFLDWQREGRDIVGLRYWSTQKSTKGIGERVERFAAEGGKGVDPAQLYIARIGRPDAAFRLGVPHASGTDVVVGTPPAATEDVTSEDWRWCESGPVAVGVAKQRFDIAGSGSLAQGVDGLWIELREADRARRRAQPKAVTMAVVHDASMEGWRSARAKRLARRLQVLGRGSLVLVVLDAPEDSAALQEFAQRCGLAPAGRGAVRIFTSNCDSLTSARDGDDRTPFSIELLPRH